MLMIILIAIGILVLILFYYSIKKEFVDLSFKRKAQIATLIMIYIIGCVISSLI